MRVNAFITAGGRPGPKHPLYPESRGGPKVMIDIAGKPMVQWVIDALDEAETVGRILIVGLEDGTGLSSKKPLDFFPDQGNLFRNVAAGFRQTAALDPSVKHVLAVSGDLPAIRGEIADWLVRETVPEGLDICYTVARREIMEKKFPESRRTYIPLRGERLCAGSMHVLSTEQVISVPKVWERLAEARKNPVKMAAVIGPKVLFGLLFRRLTVEALMKIFCRRFRITGRVIFAPYAEMSMDVDKPHHLEVMRRHLSARGEDAREVGGRIPF